MKYCMILLFGLLSLYSQPTGRNASQSFMLVVDQIYNDELKKSQLSIQSFIPFDKLSFQRENSKKFKAQYELSIQIIDKENNVLFSDFRRKNEFTDNYRITNSNRLRSTLKFNVDFKTGNYIIKGMIRDINGGNVYTKSLPYNIQVSEKKELILANLDIYDIVDGEKTISNDHIFNNQRGKLSAEFRIYDTKNDSIWYNVLVKNKDNKVLFTKVLDRINFESNDFVDVSVEIDKERLSDSQLELLVQAKIKSVVVNELKTSLRFQWSSYPLHKKDMRIALEQMMYILDLDSIEYYSDSDIKSSQDFFKRFWITQSKTKTFEDGMGLMSEYFKRVAFSNKYFSSLQKSNTGWRSDMGRIYIKFGPPNDIVKDEYIDPYRKTRLPRITWHYFNLRQRFYFYDRTGFNEFELDRRSKELENQL